MTTEERNRDELLKFFLEGETENVMEKLQNFERLMMRYRSAIREVTTKLEVLNDELSLIGNRNPIETIQSRVKRPVSISGKLKKLGKPLTAESIEENLNDVAGIRVICSFIDDIYRVADMLTCQDDIKVIEIKDYIKNPKSNGYRSYHIILEIPVFFSDCKKPMRVEVQIRTVAMDFWASLEHQIKYKKDIPEQELEYLAAELKDCAETIAQTDRRMQDIKKRIHREE
nr:GTP pyrophosphokinase family protein [uncultured Sellimonas sp.]